MLVSASPSNKARSAAILPTILALVRLIRYRRSRSPAHSPEFGAAAAAAGLGHRKPE